jgi:TolB-like protein
MTQAVFLSYASEDAIVASRICESLRGAAIEVWFDQSELRGGDAWDAAIRKQIKSCALFIPVISASAHARIEGYFRLEWKLAIDRSHLIAPDQAFLLPVVIDDTPKNDERIPDRFRELQWTRLPAGNAPPAFIALVRRLLYPGEQVSAPAPQVGSPLPQFTREPRPRGSIRWLLVAGAGVITAATIVWQQGWLNHLSVRGPPTVASVPVSAPALPEQDKSIAVLPFVDMSEKKDQAYFADGLSEELIDLLAKMPELRVAARTSAFSFRGKPSTVAEIGKTLNVGHIVEGSVRKSGDSIRITVQLVQAETGYHLWSETYDRRLSEIFKIQDEIAASVVRAMKLQLLAGALPSSGKAEHVRAYNSLLQCRFLGRTGKEQRALECAEHVVAIDPTYAVAWVWLSWYLGNKDSQDPRVCAAARRALELDPALADAHVALAECYIYTNWDWKQAEVEYTAALALDENNPQGLKGAGRLAMYCGRLPEAMNLARRATERDPANPSTWITLADAQWLAGLSKAAQDNYRRALDIVPNDDDAHSSLAIALLDDGNSALALSELMQVSDESTRLWPLAIVYFHMGRKVDSDKTLATLTEKYADSNAGVIAVVHAYRNEKDAAFEWIGRAYRQHDDGLAWLKVQKLMVNIHGDPRFQEWIRKLNFPD